MEESWGWTGRNGRSKGAYKLRMAALKAKLLETNPVKLICIRCQKEEQEKKKLCKKCLTQPKA